MNRIKQILLSIFHPRESKSKVESKCDDIFFVNDDFSISLNHDSETVKNAFKRNISALKEIEPQAER